MPDVPIERYTLDNGLRVTLSPDPRAPIVAVNLWYDVGSKHEKPGKTGFAHLFEHMMFQGTASVEKGEHFKLVQAAGGTLNASTWLDRTNYFETLPAHELELALWLEADRMATLLDALDQANLENQREVVKNEKRQSYDNRPYGSFYERIMAALFPPGHPYHHTPIGSMDDLNAATLDDVIEFFRAWYAPNNAVLSIAGDVDVGEAHAAAARYFGPIPANPRIVQPPPLPVELGLGGERREVVHDAVPLTRIHFGFHPQRQLELVAGQRLEVVRPVEPGRRVVDPAGALDDREVLDLGDVAAALEHEVLEQVGEAGAAGLLVPRADDVPQVDRHDRRQVVRRDDDAQPVGERPLVEADQRQSGGVQRLGVGHRRIVTPHRPPALSPGPAASAGPVEGDRGDAAMVGRAMRLTPYEIYRTVPFVRTNSDRPSI
jgi:hypothetical protein